MAVVGMQVSAGGLHRGVPEDVLEDVQRDAGVCHPGRAGVAEAVPGEIGQTKIAHDLVPVRRVPHGRGRECAALRADQQPVLGLLAVIPAGGSGLRTIPVAAGPPRVEYLAWSSFNPTPAARALLESLPTPQSGDAGWLLAF